MTQLMLMTLSTGSMPLNILLLVGGIVLVLKSADWLTDGAVAMASRFGVSQIVIGLTIVAMGTSMPELATSMVAARKGNSDIAIGNVIGSNVFNILMILGVTGAVAPLHIQGITTVDLSTMGVSTVVLWLFARTKYTVARWEGGVLVALFAAYMWWLIATV